MNITSDYQDIQRELIQQHIDMLNAKKAYVLALALADLQDDADSQRVEFGVPFSQSTWDVNVSNARYDAWDAYASKAKRYNEIFEKLVKFERNASELGVQLPQRHREYKRHHDVSCATRVQYHHRDASGMLTPCSFYEAHPEIFDLV